MRALKNTMAHAQKSLVDRFKVSISSTGHTFIFTDKATGYAYEFGISAAEGVEGRLVFNLDYPEKYPFAGQKERVIKKGEYVFAAKR